MKIGVLGSVIEGKVRVDVKENESFSDIFCSIQDAVGKGSLWDKFNLHVAEVQDRKVRPSPHVIKPTDTPNSLGLPPTGALVVLRSMEPARSARDSSKDASESKASDSRSYRDRMIAIYQKYEPAKVGTVDASLKKFKGKEEAVIRQLVKKYGPEPSILVNSATPSDTLASSSLPSRRESNDNIEPSSPLPKVVEEKKGNSGAKNDLNKVNTTSNDSAPTQSVQMGKPMTSGTASASVNSVSAAPLEKTLPDKVSSLSKPHLEPYGFQKNYKAPTNHDLLDEPISETDTNSNLDGRDGTDIGVVSSLKQTENVAVHAAPVVQSHERLETRYTQLRDLEKQNANFPHDSRGIATTTAPAAHIVPERPLSRVDAPRFARIVHRAVQCIGDTVESTMRRAYWTKWVYRLAQHKARCLIGAKVWAGTSGGARLVDNVPHTYVVQDLNMYVYERLVHAPRGLTVFSDALQKALRELLHAAREYHKASGNKEPSSALSFADELLCPVGDTKAVAAALVEVTGMFRELTECKEQLHAQQERVTKLDEERDEMRQELATAESFTGRFIAAQDELSDVHMRLEQAEERCRHTEDENRTMRYTIQNLQRELKKERGSGPSHMEVVVQRKDASVVALHQELAKTRTRLRSEQKERGDIAKQLEAVKLEASRLAQPLSGAKSHSASGEPKSKKAAGRTFGVGERAKLPRGFFSPQFRPEHIIDEEFQPIDAKDLNRKTDVELVRENRILEAHLESSLTEEEVDFGFCPHCVAQLTACTSERNGSPEHKAAFCFSCRKSFTFKEINERNTHADQVNRKGRGISRVGPFLPRN